MNFPTFALEAIVRRLANLVLPSFAALLVSPRELPAQQAKPVLGRYQLDVWRAQDDVRLSFASNLVQTSDGYLWLSTQSGLVRFDGVRFQVFDGTNTPALRGRANLQTYPLLEDAQHALWIATDRGLLTYDKGTFETLTRDSVVATDLVNDAVMDAAGHVWAITRLGRLFRVSRSGLRALEGANARSLGSSLTVDASGDLWIASGADGLYRVHHDSVSEVTLPPEAKLGDVTRIFASPDSSLWIGTTNAIVQWKGGRARRFPLPTRSGHGPVSKFALGANGDLWIGTDGAGVFRFDGRRFDHVTRQDGLSDDRVIDLIVDRSQNIWVATRDGLNRLRPAPFDVFTVGNGLPTELPGAMVRDSAGVIWLAPPTGGLFRGMIANERATMSSAELANTSDWVTALAVSPRGGVLAGHRKGSVTRFSSTASAGALVVSGLPPITDIREEPDGSLWIGTWHGLFRQQRGQLRMLNAKHGLPDDAIHRVFKDTEGTLWVATQSGIARAGLREEQFARVASPSGGATRSAVLFEAPRGTLWAGSADGLARVSGGAPALITTAQGLPENWIGAGELDARGGLWLGQLGGLTRVQLSDLLAVANGQAPALTSVASYSSLDGLPGGDPTAWPHPWSFHDKDGHLWFAMAHGIAVVDPVHLPEEVRAPVLAVEQTTVDGIVVPQSTPVVLGPAAQRLQFRYTGVDLSNGPGVRFRYRLDGFDTSWVDAGAFRTASFMRLAPGNYRFHVVARAGNGSWGANEATADVIVLAPLLRRPWFLGALGLFVALALWAVHRARLRTRSIAVREERSRLAREIHDSLLQGFGGIALQLHAASARMSLTPAQQLPLDRILMLIDGTLTQARETVWDMRAQDFDTEELSVACAGAAERILAGSETRVRVRQVGRTRRLSPSARAACLRIVEEALSNVRKHAHATEVYVELDYSWRRLRLVIGDNGKGDKLLLQERRPGHWGLLGMRERASHIGGTLSLDSAPSAGTRVTLEVGYANGFLTRPERSRARD